MNAILEEELSIIKDMYESCKEETSEVILFGSAVDGSRNEQSDIDVLFVAKKDRMSELNKNLEETCRLRGLELDWDVCIEDLQGYGRFYPEQKPRLHFLKIDESNLNNMGPIAHSVKQGQNITKVI